MEKFRGKTISGIKWTYMSTFLARGIYPIILVFLARLLAPADFGLVAMAVAITTLFSCFSDIGLKHALVQQKGDIEKIASIAFWILLPLGFFWFLVIWGIAPYIAEYLKNEEVIPLLRTLGLMFIIQPFSDIPLSILLRDLKFKALFYRQLVPQLFSGITSIALAFMGYGAWSLVIGNLAGIAGTSVVVWKIIDWRPKLYFDMTMFKSMFRFGSLVSIQNVLGWMMVRVSDLFIGRFLGVASLGIFKIGNTYGSQPMQLIGGPFHNVIYPVLCKVSKNMNEVRKKYLLYIKWISIIAIPATIAYVFIVPFVIPVLLGSKWVPAIFILQLFSLVYMLTCIVGINAEVYKAIGRPDISVKFFTVRVLVSLPFYYVASQESIIVLTFTHVGLACFFVPINIFICSKVLAIKYLSVLKQIRTGLFISLIFLLVGISYSPLFGSIIDNSIVNAVCLALSLMILGVIALFVIDKAVFNTLLELVKNKFRLKTEEAVL